MKTVESEIVVSPQVPNKTPEELVQLVRDIHAQRIFGTWNIDPDDTRLTGCIFMLIGLSDPRTFPDNIGHFYEYLDKANEREVNGYPTFFSCKMLSIEDSEKLHKMLVAHQEALNAATPDLIAIAKGEA